ncbi:CapA family protein [Pseudoprevotella muciniphila]|uniref:CapA family protein n=1 Tax=Pseudoprevotella muciniphila TaxID=2133944 RepID=A0A5P8E835_9BACT|nr:CapA family protein [Pseudoprevotella muciniphila]QFQ13050.1 CapA family protein [Pseudoprevotella muciniphila]
MKKSVFILIATLLCSVSCNGNDGRTNGTDNQDSTKSEATQAQQKPNPNLPDTMTISMTGDIMMGTTYPSVQLPPHEGRDVFIDTKAITQRTDIALGNLEGTLLDGGRSRKGSGPHSFSFRTPTTYGQWLKDAGYDYVCQANNHAKDFGDEGIVSTEKVLNEQGIKYSGIAGRTESAVVERNGVRYGICAFGHNSYTLKHADLANVKRIIDDLKTKSDIIIVTFHGGAEGKDRAHLPQGQETFLGENRGELRKFTHFCIDNGASVVFGHGPHVCRAMEVYKGRFIAYSLGNFCTPYGMSLSGISGYAPVVEISIGKDGAFQKGKIHSFIQQKGAGPRKDPTNAVAKQIKSLTEADITGSPIRIDNEGNITLE